MQVSYFGTDSHRLYGVFHNGVDSAQTALVLCPPFAEELVATYARFANWSKRLAEKGIAVLRFHFYGTGESGGASADFSLEMAIYDACTALEFARERIAPVRLGYFGVRLGATIAMLAALRQPVDLLVMWSPITNIQQYMRELFRAQLAKEMVQRGLTRVQRNTQDMILDLKSGRSIDLLGYEFSPQLYRQMASRWKWPDKAPAKHILWLARTTEEKDARVIVDRWKASGSRVDFTVLPEPAFWEEYTSVFPRRFAASTLDWLKEMKEI
jgi:alpha/beta superfamily hydrolase